MAWYNLSWSKRKPITLTGGSSGAQTDYQVKLTVAYDSDMQADFDDLRFTKADGTTLLDAWLESKIDSTSAIVWVKTDTPADTVDADIYMYYGNSGASSAWSGSNTFLQYAENVTTESHMSNVLNPPVVFFTDVSHPDTTHHSKVGLAVNIAENPADATLLFFHMVGALFGDSINSGSRHVVAGSSYNAAKTRYEIIWTSTKIEYWNNGVLDVTESDTSYIPTTSLGITLLDTVGMILNGDPTMYFGAVRKYAANPATYAVGSEEGWLSGWSKRKAITLTGGSSGAQTDYQVKLTVTYDSDMQANFDDIRFTQADGATLLDAWLESKTDSTSAIIWVETDTPANGIDADIYMYYGNSGASSDWDIDATFMFGDDFPGSSLDTNKWNSVISSGCSVSVSGGELLLDAPTTAADDTYAFISTKDPIFTTAVMEVRRKSTADNYMNAACGSGNDCFVYQYPKIESGYHYQGNYLEIPASFQLTSSSASCAGGYMGVAFVDSPLTSYKTHKFIVSDDASNNIRWYIDDVLKTQDTHNTYLTNNKRISLSQSEKSDMGGLSTVDWVFVHKYAANPATYAFGSEDPESAVGNPYWYYDMIRRRN